MKSKAIIVLLGILVFLLGGIAGAVCHSLYQEYLKASFIKASSQPIDIVGGLKKELNLDDQQTESLRVIFKESRDRSIALSRELWPEYQELNKEYQELNKEYQVIYRETEQQIKDILSPDQKARYEEFLKQFQAPAMAPAQPPPPQN